MATRPKAMNSAGLPIVDAEAHAAAFEARFPLLAETPDIYPHFIRMATFGPGLEVIDPATV